jgi:hypothetical protein
VTDASDVGPIDIPDHIVPGVDAGAETAARDGRHSRLEAATARMRTKSGPVPADRWFQVAGWILMPLGIALVLLGWYGTAHTTRVWEQMPFVVSGGLLGVGLLFIGGFAYYSYWLTRLVEDSRAQADAASDQTQRQTAVLERIEDLLRDQRAIGAFSGAVVAGAEGNDVLVATATGSMAHRPGCPMVAGKDNLRRVDASDPGIAMCLVCEPVLTPAANGGPKTRARRR